MKHTAVDVAIIGAGTAGLVALREVRKVTDNYILIQDGPYGTTCARVGCMPSKALIQIAHDFHRRERFEQAGILGGDQLRIDRSAVLRRVRELRDHFAGSMVNKTDRFGDRFIKARARFLSPQLLEVGGIQVVAKRTIIATGSRPHLPDRWRSLGAERIWTSDTFFEIESLPPRVAVIGLGVIGLELGQAMARLGVEVTGIARSQHLAGVTDPVVLASVAAETAKEMTLWRGHAADLSEDVNGQIVVTAGEGQRTRVDAVLVATGRQPNVDDMGLETLSVPLRADGIPAYDAGTLQVADLPVFIAGDCNAARPILHEAWDDGRIAGYNAVSDQPACFQRRTPLLIVFTDPNIAQAGLKYDDLDLNHVVIAEEDFSKQSRALIRGDNKGVLRLYARQHTGELLGTEMTAPGGEHLGHLLAWAIQQRLTVHDLLRMPVYHPVLEEGVKSVLEKLGRALHDRVEIPDLAFCDETPADALLDDA